MMGRVLTFSLNSGSNGNSIYVEAGDVRLLFDAGLPAIEAERRMKVHGRHPRDCDGLIISHEHTDHISGAGVFQRKFGLPIHATPLTMSANDCPIGKLTDVRFFMTGATLEFGDVKVHTIPTPHDARDPVMFVVEHGRKRLGILTDLGHPFKALGELIGTLDAVYLESNYDTHLLDTGPYPWQLKNRIRGPGGHLSNVESATLVSKHIRPRLKWVAAAHISERNNTPEIALETHRRRVGKLLDVRHASRYGVGDVWMV